MTQEDKDLLLKDLSARLFYKPTVLLSGREHCILWGIDGDEVYLNVDTDSFYVENIKPYLRPMSSMSEEEKKEYEKACELDTEILSNHPMDGTTPFPVLYNSQDYLNSIHVDYRGLIKKGLAIEAPEGMYNIN